MTVGQGKVQGSSKSEAGAGRRRASRKSEGLAGSLLDNSGTRSASGVPTVFPVRVYTSFYSPSPQTTSAFASYAIYLSHATCRHNSHTAGHLPAGAPASARGTHMPSGKLQVHVGRMVLHLFLMARVTCQPACRLVRPAISTNSRKNRGCALGVPWPGAEVATSPPTLETGSGDSV